MMLKNCQIFPQLLSQSMLSPYAYLIKAIELNLLVLHINDCEIAIFQISALEKKGQVTNWKTSQLP